MLLEDAEAPLFARWDDSGLSGAESSRNSIPEVEGAAFRAQLKGRLQGQEKLEYSRPRNKDSRRVECLLPSPGQRAARHSGNVAPLKTDQSKNSTVVVTISGHRSRWRDQDGFIPLCGKALC